MPNKLKLITDKAKKLYKTGKYKKWTDAIKQASKSIGAVKIIQKGESKNAKVTKTLMQKRNKKGQFKGYSVISGVGKVAKKKVAKKKVAKSYHKDTKSHNVRISVMSGDYKSQFLMKEDIVNRISSLLKYNSEIEKYIKDWKDKIKYDKSTSFIIHQKSKVKNNIKRYNELLKSNKKYLSELKKQIK